MVTYLKTHKKFLTAFLTVVVLLLLVDYLGVVACLFHCPQEKEEIVSEGEVLSAEEELLVQNSPVNPLVIGQAINLGQGKQVAHLYHLFNMASGLALIDYKSNFLQWLPEGQIITDDYPYKAPGEYLEWFHFDELDDIYTPGRELLVQYANPGTAGVHPFYLYSYDGESFKLLFKLIEASNKVEIRDLDGVWPDEIVHEYSISGSGKLERDLLRFKDIWRLQDGKPIKINHLFPQEYQELIDLHILALTKKEWEPDVSSYYPVLRCLKEKAELTSQGKEIGIDECQEILRKRYAGSGE